MSDYLKSYGSRSGKQVGEQVLGFFTQLFSLEMPLGRMVKMMPGMVKFALKGSDCRRDLVRFAPEMTPMIKKALGLGEKKAG